MNKENTKTALLLIDIQNDYFENGNMALVGSETAGNNTKWILEKFRNDKLPVLHVQHIALKPTATFFLPGTKGAEIHDYVKPAPQEKVIVKHFPNSFRETELLGYLRKSEITDLVICGMMTHMCVDATVRAAKDFGFTITLIGDACATKDLELNGNKAKAADVQTSFLAALNQTYAKIEVTSNYLLT
ncbi:MAG TPA: cysteine hydrolase family protein [Bacteroidales bacterium]|nr:cysteine hydrolase family protein [Bacteroidales bacterium]